VSRTAHHRRGFVTRTPSSEESNGDDSPVRRVSAAGIVLAAATAVLAISLGPPAAVAAPASVGSLQSVRCASMASDPALEAPLYAQQKGASSKSDAWWCELPHATQVPGGMVPLRRDVAPLPKGYAIEETVYSAAGQAKDASITSKGPPSIIVEVKLNSAVAPGPTAHVPQFSSSKKVVLKEGVTANVLSEGGQSDVSWGYPTTGVPKYLSAVASVTVAGFGVPAATVIAVAKHVAPL
jgi:hypothetical protein